MAVTSNYEPYEPNPQGFTEALLDFKSTFGGTPVTKVLDMLLQLLKMLLKAMQYMHEHLMGLLVKQ